MTGFSSGSVMYRKWRRIGLLRGFKSATEEVDLYSEGQIKKGGLDVRYARRMVYKKSEWSGFGWGKGCYVALGIYLRL